jgi:Protein of unknown function (DUF3306)
VTSEPFLRRWSRLKRRPAQNRETAKPERAAEAAPTEAALPAAPAARAGAKPAATVDLEALPSIDTLTAKSDIRAFLQEGVPAELRAAALRRAWTADPAIRDFIGIAENQWDFTDPAGIPGFGTLAPGEGVGQLVAAALGDLQKGLASEPSPSRTGAAAAAQTANVSSQVPGIPDGKQSLSNCDAAVEEQQNETLAAAQHTEAAADFTRSHSRRTHGRALPK